MEMLQSYLLSVKKMSLRAFFDSDGKLAVELGLRLP